MITRDTDHDYSEIILIHQVNIVSVTCCTMHDHYHAYDRA